MEAQVFPANENNCIGPNRCGIIESLVYEIVRRVFHCAVLTIVFVVELQ